MLPEPPKAFYWHWLSAIYKYGIYNPLFRNTKDKMVRFFGSWMKSKREREMEQKGFFGRFTHEYREKFQAKTQGAFEFYNPFSKRRSFIKRKFLYYGSILVGVYIFIVAAPMIFANVVSGPKSQPAPYPPAGSMRSSPSQDKDIEAL